MEINLYFFARLREVIGTKTITRSFQEGLIVRELVETLKTEFPALSPLLGRTLIAVNREFSDLNTVLKSGDEVAFFPPVSGGSDDKFAITFDPISLDGVAAKVVKPETGAVALFSGVVRNVSGGKAVEYLEYEAYEAMAVEKLQQVAAEARAQWPDIVDMAIVQRIGHLAVGETAVIIAVSSGHRGGGCFEACQFAIERLKQIVPVWKKKRLALMVQSGLKEIIYLKGVESLSLVPPSPNP